MILNNQDELLFQSELYGYCHKTQEWEKVKTITEIIDFKVRIGYRALDHEDRKLYTQVSKDQFERLKDKFPILNDFINNKQK